MAEYTSITLGKIGRPWAKTQGAVAPACESCPVATWIARASGPADLTCFCSLLGQVTWSSAALTGKADVITACDRREIALLELFS